MAELKRMIGQGGRRKMRSHWLVTGELVLRAAAHFGTGEAGSDVDLELLRSSPTAGERADGVASFALLPGSSVAGAVRALLADRLAGPWAEPDPSGRALISLLLGGGASDSEEGTQSLLVVHDAITPLRAERRDGVCIDAKTGTAAAGGKYDLEVLPLGTRLPLEFELWVPDANPQEHMRGEAELQTDVGLESRLVSLLGVILDAFSEGEVRLGARTSRGLGECGVEAWSLRRCDLTQPDGWFALLADKGDASEGPAARFAVIAGESHEALTRLMGGGVLPDISDERNDRRTKVTLDLDLGGPMLIASPNPVASGPDVAPLNSGDRPVAPGTSLAGSLRAHLGKIAGTFCEGCGESWVGALFGDPPEAPNGTASGGRAYAPRPSRLRIDERVIEEPAQCDDSRIRLDRHSGGVLPGALFEERVVRDGKISRLTLNLIHRPDDPSELHDAEAGLLLLLAKDVAAEEVVVGGGGSIGRGILKASGVELKRGNGPVVTLVEDGRTDQKAVGVADELIGAWRAYVRSTPRHPGTETADD